MLMNGTAQIRRGIKWWQKMTFLHLPKLCTAHVFKREQRKGAAGALRCCSLSKTWGKTQLVEDRDAPESWLPTRSKQDCFYKQQLLAARYGNKSINNLKLLLHLWLVSSETLLSLFPQSCSAILLFPAGLN